MQIVIEISSYDKEWITNGYYIPEEINMRISEAIANGTPLQNGHERLIDADTFIKNRTEISCENCDRRRGMKNGKLKFVYEIGGVPCRACDIGDMIDCVDDAEVVIPADKGGD